METGKVLRRLKGAVVTALAVLALRPVLAQFSKLQRDVAAAAGSVVSVVAEWSPGVAMTGFGTIIYQTDDRFIVATAKHVVIHNPEGQAKKVTVRDQQGRYLTVATVASSAREDVAFLTVAGNVAFWNPQIVGPAAVPAGTEAWLYGVKGDFSLRPVAARVRGTAGSLISMDGLEGWLGSSGGPAFSSQGMIGMYLVNDGVASGRFLALPRIQEEAERLGIPWGLVQSGWVSKLILTQFVRQDALGGASAVEAVNVRTQRRVPVPSRGEIFAGPYTLAFDALVMRCSPAQFVVADVDEEHRVAVNCAPHVAGSWIGRRLKVLLVDIDSSSYELISVPIRPDDFRFAIRGRIESSTNDPLRYLIYGNTGSNVSVSGEIKVRPDLRSGTMTLDIDGELITEEIKR